MVRNASSDQLGLSEAAGRIMVDLRIGMKSPLPPSVGSDLMVGPPLASTPGGSSSKMTSIMGVELVAPGVKKPPKESRKSDDVTSFQALAARRIWLTNPEKVSPAGNAGDCSEIRNGTVLFCSESRSNRSYTGFQGAVRERYRTNW
jgi:hypothetical protein